MNNQSFRSLFFETIEKALRNVEKRCNIYPSRKILLELHGAGFSGKLINPEDALRLIFISDNKYYKIIDVAVKKCDQDETTIFLRISDHSPDKYDLTWDPKKNGPFKLLEGDCSTLRQPKA